MTISVLMVTVHLRTADSRGFCYAFGINAVLISNTVYHAECTQITVSSYEDKGRRILLVSVLYYLNIWVLSMNPIYFLIIEVQLLLLLGDS